MPIFSPKIKPNQSQIKKITFTVDEAANADFTTDTFANYKKNPVISTLHFIAIVVRFYARNTVAGAAVRKS